MLARTVVRNYSGVVRAGPTSSIGSPQAVAEVVDPLLVIQRLSHPLRRVDLIAAASRSHQRQVVRDGTPAQHARARRRDGGARQGTRDGDGPDRKAVRQGLGHEDGREDHHEDRDHPHRGAGARSGPRRRGPAPGSGRRDLRPRVVGQVDPGHARGGRGPAQRRHLRLHRRRARHGPDLRPGHRRRRRRAAHHPARHRRAGARDHRHARALGCARRGGHRLGGRPHAPGRDRGRDGRHPRRPPGPAHVPGAAQAHRPTSTRPTPSASSSTSCARRSA